MITDEATTERQKFIQSVDWATRIEQAKCEEREAWKALKNYEASIKSIMERKETLLVEWCKLQENVRVLELAAKISTT